MPRLPKVALGPSGQARLGNIQVLRFLAAAGVLVSHSADLVIPKTSLLWRVHWTAGVDIFFIISGFIMYFLTSQNFGRSGAAKAFLLRRLIRIVPAYWAFTTLMIVVALVLPHHVRNVTLGIEQIVTSYAFLPWPRGDGKLNPILSQGWTLNYEMFFYLTLALALYLRRGAWLIVASFLALIVAGPWVPEQWFILRFFSNPIIAEFLAGMAIAWLYLRGVRIPAWLAIGLVALGWLIPLLLPDLGHFDRYRSFGLPALCLCLAFMLRPDAASEGVLLRQLVRGGDASYTLYLSHTFVVNGVMVIGLSQGAPAWGIFAAGILLAILVAVALYELLERPATNGLRKRIGKRPSSRAEAVAP